MITEKQFLSAVETIREYQIQISKIITTLGSCTDTKTIDIKQTEATEIENKKTLVSDWINRHNKEISVRLGNILRKEKTCYNDDVPKYIEDINKNIFRTIRGAGNKSWSEFVEAKQKDGFKKEA